MQDFIHITCSKIGILFLHLLFTKGHSEKLFKYAPYHEQSCETCEFHRRKTSESEIVHILLQDLGTEHTNITYYINVLS
jgi:hypothetical protein